MPRSAHVIGRVAQVTTFAGSAAAEAWSRSAATRAAYMAETTKKLLDLAEVAVGQRVLAIGSGTGEEAFEAAARVGSAGQVVATDISPEMVAAARAAAAQAGHTNVQFAVMDAQRLEFPDAVFDAVIARNSLMFIPDLAVGLAEMRRVLKPSGRIGASVWSGGARNPRISTLLGAAGALGAQLPESTTYRLAFRLGTPALITAAFRAAGFTGVVVQRVRLVARYATLADAVESTLELPATRELIDRLGSESTPRMRRLLERRWARFADRGQVLIPGEQLVAAANA
jgi:ubiquinone/menaquinone biosynthesis C-methylase UbiE